MKSNKMVEINISDLKISEINISDYFFQFIPRDYLLAELPIYSFFQSNFTYKIDISLV